MTGSVGLYYPFIHFRNEAWLKLTCLYWDRMGRIVPKDYPLRDSDTVSALKDGGYVLDYQPLPGGDQLLAATAFQRLLADHGEQLRQRYGLHLADSWPDDPATVGWRSAHFGSPKLGHVFGEKIPPAFVEQLIELDLAVRGGRHDPYWIGMHPKLATLYMLALADAMARRRGAHPITDDTLNHLAVGGFNMERLAEALLDDVMEPQPPSDQEVEQLEAGLVLQVAVPADLDHVPVDKLLEFREKYAAERAAFQHQVEALARSLHDAGVTDAEALRGHVQAQYDKMLRPQLADLRRRLRDANIEAVMGLMNVKTLLPPGLLAVGGSAAAGEIAGTAVGGTAVAVAIWRVLHARLQARRAAVVESPATAYLYHLATDLQPAALASHIHHLSHRFLPGR
jgi:hypothetical protein